MFNSEKLDVWREAIELAATEKQSRMLIGLRKSLTEQN
jgi:hypothetical protein